MTSPWPAPTPERFGAKWAHLYAYIGHEVRVSVLENGRRVVKKGKLLAIIGDKAQVDLGDFRWVNKRKRYFARTVQVSKIMLEGGE